MTKLSLGGRSRWAAAVVAAGALAASPAVAGADSVSNTVTPTSGVVQDPCTGAMVTFSGNLHSTLEATESSDGGTHGVVHVNAQDLSGVGTDGTRYELPQNSNQEINVAIGTGQESTSVTNLRVVSQGASPNFAMLLTIHVTVSASGQLNVTSHLDSGQCAA